MKRFVGAAVVFFALAMGAAFGQTGAGVGDPGTQLSDLLTGSGLQVKFGYRSNFLTKKSDSYFNLSFKGSEIYTHGSAISNSEFGIGEDPIKFGDTPLALKLGAGLSEVGGTLFQTYGVHPIPLPGLKSDRFRFIAGIDGQLDNAAQRTAFGGAEWVPLGPFSADGENFAGLSLRYEERRRDDADSETAMTGSLRARFGKGFGFVVTDERVEEVANLLLKLQEVAPERTYEFLTELDQKKGLSLPRFVRAMLSVYVGDAVEDSTLSDALKGKYRGYARTIAQWNTREGSVTRPSQSEYQIAVDELAKVFSSSSNDVAIGIDSDQRKSLQAAFGASVVRFLKNRKQVLKAIAEAERKNAPTLSLFAEFDGSLALADERIAGQKGRYVYSLNARYALHPKDENSPFLWLRYENGRTRAEPDKWVNSLILTATFKF